MSSLAASAPLYFELDEQLQLMLIKVMTQFPAIANKPKQQPVYILYDVHTMVPTFSFRINVISTRLNDVVALLHALMDLEYIACQVQVYASHVGLC